jgi:methoxymalonate biosynthesis acyl carrier protein
VREQIREFVRSNLNIFGDDVTFTDADNIFQSGLVNSLFAVQLIAFLEKQFAIRITNEDMNIANFSSVDRMVALVESKKSG